MISVAVFAHNEEAGIGAALAAIAAAGLDADDRVTVLVNGTTDRTMARVEEVAARDRRIRGVEIAFGDKANAWDVYVQRLAPEEAEAHVFIDGDVQVSAGSIALLRAALAAHPEALAASALPRGGRRAEDWAARVLENHGLPGNFYALRGSVVARMRGRFWMPVGLIGDDTFLRNMLLRDLDPQAAPVPARIRPVPGARFDYRSFPLTSVAGVRALWRRHRRYALREAQMHVLMRHLARTGIAGLPRRIDALYGDWAIWPDMRAARVGFGPRRLLFPLVIPPARRTAGQDLGPGLWYADED